jgi:hypothetical protein
MSLDKTVIKYIVTGSRQFEIPIINITPIGDIEIKITFPDSKSTKTWVISTNKKVTITLKCEFDNNDVHLIANDNILGTKDGFYNNGTIIVTGECTVEESHYMYYDA